MLRLPQLRARLSRAPSRGLATRDLPDGFSVVASRDWKEFGALHLRHDATGAEHVHLSNADPNRAFSVCFRTPVQTSSGLPHVLEHTVLCGSERYPVRDPFFNMLKRSVNTFMNALTASDYTMYPFSTTNAKDFGNLLDVYLDATFFPLLTEQDFRQEGHRLEVAADGQAGLERKGVVLNEMKGVMSDPGTLYHYRLDQLAGYPAVSGGDPAAIPELEWAHLTDFHRRHYQPGNALFFSYGDLDLPALLRAVDERVLSRCPAAPPAVIPAAAPAAAGLQRFAGPPDSMGEPGRQTRVSSVSLAHGVTDIEETQLVHFVSRLLLNGVGSPMYEALIGSRLGAQFAPGTGFHASAPQTYFAVGAEGVEDSDEAAQAVCDAIRSTLERVASEGFDPDRVEAALHQLELNERAIDSNQGVRLLYSVAQTWAHGGNVLDMLGLRDLAKLKARLQADPDALARVVREVLAAPAFSAVMTPDEGFLDAQAAEEQAALDRARETADFEALRRQAAELEELQSAQQDVDVLPTLTLEDVERQGYTVPGAVVDELAGQPCLLIPATTNGLVHLRLAFDVQHLSENQLRLLPLMLNLITAVGAGDWDHKELAVRLDLNCGGIGAELNLIQPPSQPEKLERLALVAISCLHERLPAALQLLERVLGQPSFGADAEHLAGLLSLAASSAAGGVVDSGHSMALRWASAGVTAAGPLLEATSGLSQVRLLREVARLDAGLVGAELSRLAASTFSADRLLRTSVTTDAELMGGAVAGLRALVDSGLATTAAVDESGLVLPGAVDGPPTGRDFIPLPIAVNFVADVYPTVTYNHPDFAALRVLGKVLGSCFLHREVREKGGAYGAFCVQSGGTFANVSYYDPNTLDTLDAYARGARWAAEGGFTERDVHEAKLSLFGDLDAPQAPPSLGSTWFVTQVTDAERQQHRDELFAVTPAAVAAAAAKYLSGGPAGVAVVGASAPESSSPSEKHWSETGGWTVREGFSSTD